MLPRKLTLIAALLALLLPLVSQAQPGKPLTADMLFAWTWVADPQIHPDGSLIAYVRITADKRKDNYRSAIWFIRPDGSGHRQLTGGHARDFAPRWSPEGQRLAFLSTRRGKPQIFILDLEQGGEARQLTHQEKGAGNPAWSPDGGSIAFTSFVPKDNPDNDVAMPAKPEGAEWAAPPKVTTRLHYRHDARGYLPNGFTHIFVIPAKGGPQGAPRAHEARQLTSGDYDHGAPRWSADGTALIFSAVRTPNPDWDINDPEIFSVSVRTGRIQQLTDHRGPDRNPRVSPDGRFIAFSGYDEHWNSYSLPQLYVMNADGSNLRMLTADWDQSVGGGVYSDAYAPFGGRQTMQWAPDSSGIYFLSGHHGSSNLYFASLEGSLRPITRGAHDLRSFSLAPNGSVAGILSTITRPYDLCSFTLENRQPRWLTALNAHLLRERKLYTREMFWYDSFDGRKMQAWLWKPADFDPSKKYPLLLQIHGGPHAMYGEAFAHEYALQASQGYLVLFPNPRGSSGYGQEFGNIIQYAYPGEDYRDLMVGVDELLKRGYVDATRLGVIGGSGGGVLSSWTIGQTQRFAAAVVQRPVINWYSWAGTSDIGYSATRRWFRKPPWEDQEDYMRRSPISYVGNVTTATLVFHSEEDYRCPIDQGAQYYTALKVRQVDAKLVQMPGESHSLRIIGRPSHRIARLLHIMKWLDDHLHPAPAN
ncbi:MAG: prolyl oligopeptidase family serine peptidase [Terriglobia bacterium]